MSLPTSSVLQRKRSMSIVLQPNKVEVLPNGLAGIPDGLRRLQDNKVSGTKLVAHPQETA